MSLFERLRSETVELVRAPLRQMQGLERLDHRPWPLPDRPALMGQSWIDLLFVHWSVPVSALREFVPPSLKIDTHEGKAWIGVTPFRIAGLRPRLGPALPVISTFEEINVRTYVTFEGKPGIWFLSLDAQSLPGVLAARAGYHLPYHYAVLRHSCHPGGEAGTQPEHRYSATRVSGSGRFRASFTPREISSEPFPGTFAHWASERYCLYSEDRDGVLYRADIHHAPWRVASAYGEVFEDSLVPESLRLTGEPRLHYGPRQDVLIWSAEPVLEPLRDGAVAPVLAST
jgi:uncharacterized protein